MARKSTGRKRDRGDHSVEPNKREHSDTTDERGMEPALRLEDMHEVEELTDAASGGLAFPAGVIKMLDIMHTVQLDAAAGAHAAEQCLAKRALLAKIVASTSRADCAALFFREGGLAQLQAWLAEAVQAATDFPSAHAQVERLLIALLIAVERLREQAERLQEGTLALVAALAAPEAQFSDHVKLRARRLGSSWGPEGRRRRGWEVAGESSTSGAEAARESKGDTSPSTSAERDESADTVSSRAAGGTAGGAAAGQREGKGSAGEGRWSRDAGVEEAAGIMRLNMNSPVAAAPLPPSFGGAPEESGSRGGNEGQEPERSKYAKIDTASGSSMPGGLPGGAPQWGPQPHEEGHGLCRGGAGRGARRRDGSVAGAATELARGLATLRVCGSARRKGVWGEGASWRERRQAALHGEELLEEAGGAGARGASWQAGGTGGGLPWMGEMVRLDEDPQVAGWGTWRGEWREGQCGCVCWTDPESNGRDV